jgi:hypothetical protein
VDDDEKQLVGMLGLRSRPLEIEKLAQGQVRAVVDLLLRPLRFPAQNVDTSSVLTSSTRMVSVVKNGSP